MKGYAEQSWVCAYITISQWHSVIAFFIFSTYR
jgi:hypothetical protein